MRIVLRQARIEDLPILERWDSQKHVIESDPHDDWNWAVELKRFPTWREQLIAEAEGRPIGFVQIIDPALEESRYWGECATNLRAIDIWIGDESDLNRGFGTEMMTQAIERCFESPGVEKILIDPLEGNEKSHRFYERLGFRFIEKRRFGLDDCRVYALEKAVWRERALR